MPHRREADLAEEWWEIAESGSHYFVVGLDLGKSQDFTALAVNQVFHAERRRWQRTRFEPTAGVVSTCDVMSSRFVALHRYPLGTPYPDVYRSVASVLHQLPARERPPELVVDKTGVGAPVVDAMREMGLKPVAVAITAGRVQNMVHDHDYTVPKALLASHLDIALQEERLKLTNGSPYSEALRTELRGFHAKIKANGNVSLEAWREGVHDDLVLAVALAVWRAENPPMQRIVMSYIDWLASWKG